MIENTIMMKPISICLFILLSLNKGHSQAIPWFDEVLVNSTIKIESLEKKLENGKVRLYKSSGTGFFFSFKVGGDSKIPVIVTNRHVVKDSYRGTLYFKHKDSSGLPIFGKTEKLVIDNFSSSWIFHPDTSVDLAILPLVPILNAYHKKNSKPLFFSSLPEEIIPSDSVTKTFNAIEDIIMIGYPYGLRDSTNDLPIVRRGISATPLYLDYTGKKEFLIDMPVFFGSSGSPILIFNHSVWSPRYAEAPRAGDRVILVGINFATFTRDFEGRMLPKISQSLEDSLRVQTNIPLYNLGIVIKSQRLLDFKRILLGK